MTASPPITLANASTGTNLPQLFFALNLAFNGVMWGLFTRALTLSSSTVRVSIINTSANFIVTAVLGALVFSEKLPGQWWLGAAMLVAGSVIIGMRDDTEKKDVKFGTGDASLLDRNGSANVTSSRDADESVKLRSTTRSNIDKNDG
jgi:drug/metabolite transporter (DMT)-like permease